MAADAYVENVPSALSIRKKRREGEDPRVIHLIQVVVARRGREKRREGPPSDPELSNRSPSRWGIVKKRGRRRGGKERL